MAITYEPIATTTLSSASNNITFTSIPQTYTDLVLVASVYGNFGSTSAAAFRIVINGDTATNYSNTNLSGNGSAASSSRSSSYQPLEIGQLMAANSTSSSTFTPVIVHFFNYTNTTTFKTIIGRYGSEDGTNTNSRRTGVRVGLWRKTPEAITSFAISTDATNYVIGSSFTLYGIKAA